MEYGLPYCDEERDDICGETFSTKKLNLSSHHHIIKIYNLFLEEHMGDLLLALLFFQSLTWCVCIGCFLNDLFISGEDVRTFATTRKFWRSLIPGYFIFKLFQLLRKKYKNYNQPTPR
jgi:hypothetical protein